MLAHPNEGEIMFINKIGYSHWELGGNNHDYGFAEDHLKCVVDGCSEGLHSEVGVKLFCLLLKNLDWVKWTDAVEYVFKKIMTITGDHPSIIKNYLLFTILLLEEKIDHYKVNTCGDGIIIKELFDNSFEYEIINQNNTPLYYGYKFVPSNYFLEKIGKVKFTEFIFPKDQYKTIGIASDGLSFILNSEFKEEFEEYLRERKEVKIKRLINREHRHFKDDITIVF